MAIGTDISIITLNVNGLNASTKRYKVAEWIQKQDPHICCLQETHFGEGGGRGVQDGEHMYTHGGFMSMYGKTIHLFFM